jgi:hypothetical protein
VISPADSRRTRPRRGRVGMLGLVVCLLLVYGVVVLTSPWALHIGGRWTPLLYWQGSGKLVTKRGGYPLYVYFFPSSHFSRLSLDGQRPTGGVQGAGWLCTSPGVTQYLKLSGTIYGGWRSTKGSLIGFRLLERKVIDVGQRQGFFDLYGRWDGPELVMADRDGVGGAFRSGLKIEHPSVTFDWGGYSDFKAACASTTNSAR